MHYNNTFNRFYQSSTTPSQVEMKRFRWKARNIRHKYVNYILVLTWNTIWAKRNFCSAMKQKCFKNNFNGNKNWVSNRYDRNPTNKIYLLIDTGDKWWAIWIIKVPDKHNSHRLKARNLHRWMTMERYLTYELTKETSDEKNDTVKISPIWLKHNIQTKLTENNMNIKFRN